ncbi:hypothetical protein Acr_26g0009410 [Actinidia rufa]|uniref:BRCT domain-containing protein n=1 Tax=Actinidia rufa TaxID=165716 RepID=A0A7J0H3U4_9ERIC|nr:hypothetical protein Acr_26g0009410 [Actinidia rufa]
MKHVCRYQYQHDTNAKGACCRTLKALKAILKGIWILETDCELYVHLPFVAYSLSENLGIKTCMEALHPVDEEPYEATKFFNGLRFYFSGDFESAYKEDLEDLIITAGGIVFEDKKQLFARRHDALATPSVTLVVINNNEYKLEDRGSIVSKRRVLAENLVDEIGSEVIAHTWLLESIAACELQPLAC